MNREDIIQDGLRKVKKVIRNMLDSIDPKDTARRVKIKNKLYIEVVCVRIEKDEDDDMLGFYMPVGTPIKIELYVIKNDEDIDGLTCRNMYKEDIMEEEIYYLLNCYV